MRDRAEYLAKGNVMSDEKKNWLGPYIPQGNVFQDVLQQAKLAFNLMVDPRVHPLAKLVPIASVAYLFFPFDIVTDFAPVLGQLDDLALIMLGFRLFFEFSPPEVVREHLRRLAEKAQWQTGETPPPTPSTPKDDVVDGSFTEAPPEDKTPGA
jgi:uncharacterized membrane protein YkvA (DUF1232 family)